MASGPLARRTSVSVAMVDWRAVDLAPQSSAAAIVAVPVDPAPRSADAAKIRKQKQLNKLKEAAEQLMIRN